MVFKLYFLNESASMADLIAQCRAIALSMVLVRMQFIWLFFF